MDKKRALSGAIIFRVEFYSCPCIVRPNEVKSLKSLKLEDAINTIEYDNKKEMLKKADSYLKRRSSN